MSRARAALIPLAIFAVALALALIGSRATGPSFEELDRLASVSQCERVVRALASGGPSALVSDEARQSYQGLGGRSTLLSLAGAWSKLSLGRIGLFDPLTSARLPWLVVSCLGATALGLLVWPSHGLAAALFAAGVLVVLPRWFHGVAVTSDGVLLASVLTIVLAAYVRSIAAASAKRRLCWSIATAVLIGFGLALTLSSAWVLLLLALHLPLARATESLRLARRGRLPAPTALLLALPIAPALSVALNPALWKTNGAELVRFFLSPLQPSIAPADYRGELVSALPVPAGFSPTFLAHTLPAAILVSALAGGVWLAHRALARRFASGSLRPPRDRAGLGTLLALGLGGAVIGPALAPDVLTRFPPRTELALPFVAALAGIALGAIARAQRPKLGHALAAAVIALAAVGTLRAPATLASSFSPWLGGVGAVTRARLLPAGDGSELVALAPALEASGNAVVIAAPDVPPALWRALAESKRLGVSVSAAPPASGVMTLTRGSASGDVAGVVERGGARLWTLTR